MAITSAEARVWHIGPDQVELAHVAADWTGRTLRKTSLFAVAATLIVVGVGVWAASTTAARVAPSIGDGIEPFKLMMNAKELPSVEFVDYTLVFH